MNEYYCFNGATSSRTWKPDRYSAAVEAAVLASMEPRPHERGNIVVGDGSRIGKQASMEPRPHERGNVTVLITKDAWL